MTKDRNAGRSKTIRTPPEAGEAYLSRCLRLTSPAREIEAVRDRTVLGDLFDAAALLPEQCVDLMIADPPYNRNKRFAEAPFPKKSVAEYAAWTRRWLEAVLPLLKGTASVYVCCDWESSLIVGPILTEYLHVRNRITWQREKGRGAAANWKNSMEDIWFATVGEEYTFHLDAVKQRRRVIAPYQSEGKPKDWTQTPDGKFRDTCPSNFWDDLTVPFWSMAENTAHPTQKPEKLAAKLILASSDPGGLVFDPFLGSGTSSVAAKKLGRHWLGIERQAQYCAWAEQRLELAETDRTIQGYAGGVFWERNSFAQQKQYLKTGRNE